jgi:hypothetical protein
VVVDHVHASARHGANTTEIREHVNQVAPTRARARERLEAGLARLLLEAIARDEAEQDRCLRACSPVSRRITARRCLSTSDGHEVQHGQWPTRAHASSSS